MLGSISLNVCNVPCIVPTTHVCEYVASITYGFKLFTTVIGTERASLQVSESGVLRSGYTHTHTHTHNKLYITHTAAFS